MSLGAAGWRCAPPSNRSRSPALASPWASPHTRWSPGWCLEGGETDKEAPTENLNQSSQASQAHTVGRSLKGQEVKNPSKLIIRCHTMLYKFQPLSSMTAPSPALSHGVARPSRATTSSTAPNLGTGWRVWNVTSFILKGLKRSTFCGHLILRPPTGQGENSTKPQREGTLRRNTRKREP